MLLGGALAVNEFDRRAPPPEGRYAVLAGEARNERVRSRGISEGFLTLMRVRIYGEGDCVVRGDGYGIDRAVKVPSFADCTIFLRLCTGFEGDFVAPLVALACEPEKVRNVTVGYELLRTQHPKFPCLDCYLDLGVVIQALVPLGQAEFGLNRFENLLDIGDCTSGVVKVCNLLRPHCPGSFSSRLLYEKMVCGIADRAVAEVNGLDVGKDIIAVGRALLERHDRLTCGLEAVEQLLNTGDSFGSSGSREQIYYALQDVAEAFGRNCVFGLQCPELGDYLGE